ncbi:MAG: hypothetical protein KDD47_04090, partial [Acidobacteria bacterium]|nr:hypothetical protein [Acidobacteriota bacterium]
VRHDAAQRIFEEATSRPRRPRKPALIVLAGNIPALAVQPLLPALALRRPVLLKSPSAEPYFAATFVSALARRLPALGDSLAALCWKGGEEGIEGPVLAAAGRILAYGEQESIDDLRRRAPCPVVSYGPRFSLAVLGPGTRPDAVAEGLARDIALFDQRGCLSVHAVYTAGDPRDLGEALAQALARRALSWPPGTRGVEEEAALRQELEAAHLRGLPVFELPMGEGAVIVEEDTRLRPSPGLRLVRIHHLKRLEDLPPLLSPWRDQLQGAALAAAASLQSPLAALGVSRFAAPGELQSPDATWHNGGIDPLDALD